MTRTVHLVVRLQQQVHTLGGRPKAIMVTALYALVASPLGRHWTMPNSHASSSYTEE